MNEQDLTTLASLIGAALRGASITLNINAGHHNTMHTGPEQHNDATGWPCERQRVIEQEEQRAREAAQRWAVIERSTAEDEPASAEALPAPEAPPGPLPTARLIDLYFAELDARYAASWAELQHNALEHAERETAWLRSIRTAQDESEEE